MKKRLHILFSLSLLLLSVQLFAQPANDNCGDAIAAMDGTTSFSTIDATEDGPILPMDGGCLFGDAGDTIYNDIWYTYTASIDGEIEWSICGTADFDTKIGVYAPGSACPPDSLDLITCNEDGVGCENFTSVVIFTAVAGETYLLRLGGYGPGGGEPGEEGSGSFTLGQAAEGPENDNCEDAIEVFTGFDQEFTTINANTDGPEHPDNPCFGFGSLSADSDIWYLFTPDFTGFAEWSVCDMATFDTRMAIYYPNITCPVADEDLYACNDDGENCPNFSSKVAFEVTAGETYLLRLGGWNGESGSGTFHLTEFIPPEPPVNDDCANAIPTCLMSPQQADDFDYAINGTTLNATFDSEVFIDPICVGNEGEYADVWYSFHTFDNTEVGINIFAQTPGAQFFVDVWASCESMVDTSVITDICFYASEVEPNIIDTIKTLEPNTDYLLHVSTRITTDMSGNFVIQLIGNENSDGGSCLVNTENPEVTLLDKFTIQPNPAKGVAELTYGLKESSSIAVEVMNTVGARVFQAKKGNLSAGNYVERLDLSTYPEGIYFVTVFVDGVPQTKRLVRQ